MRASPPRRKPARFAKLVLLAGSILASLAVAEVVSRLVLPVSPGAEMVALDGSPIEWYTNDLTLVPSLELRHVAEEFDVVLTTTRAGHRGPEMGRQPAVVFVGDSFTFGQGLADEDTFAARYCRATGESCANLGRGGTGTLRQLDILEHFLDTKGWHPGDVKLFVLAMSSSLMAGNDLLDNLNEEAAGKSSAPSAQAEVSWKEWLLSYRRALLEHSNLMRAAYFQFGPALRSALSPSPEPARLAAALAATARQIERLDALSRRHGFSYEVYLLHPVQDLLRGTHADTLSAIEKIAPHRRVIDTAGALSGDPAAFYFAYDGHLNAAGARRVAELLIRRRGAAQADGAL